MTLKLNKVLNLLLLILGVMDWGLTHVALQTGMVEEANQLFVPLVGTHWFWIIKLGAHLIVFTGIAFVLIIVPEELHDDFSMIILATALWSAVIWYGWIVAHNVQVLVNVFQFSGL